MSFRTEAEKLAERLAELEAHHRAVSSDLATASTELASTTAAAAAASTQATAASAAVAGGDLVHLVGVGPDFSSSGAPLPTAGPFSMQAGAPGVVLDGFGVGTVTFPVAFPTGVLAVVASYHFGGSAAAVAVGAVTTSSFEVRLDAYASSTVQVDYVAIGY